VSQKNEQKKKIDNKESAKEGFGVNKQKGYLKLRQKDKNA